MIRDEISKAVSAALPKKFGKRELPEVMIEAAENSSYGDYALNAAKIAGYLKREPAEFALELAKELELSKWRAEARNSFINFTLKPAALQNELKVILKRGERYGRGRAKKEKLQVEFISANPTGPLTLANGRGGFLGDVLANVLAFSGMRVEREYYVNDTGNQILTFGKSLLASLGIIPAEENFYKGGYVKDWAVRHKSLVRKYQNKPLKLGRCAARDFLAEIKKVVQKADISFDRFTSEYALHQKSFVKKALALFRSKRKVYEKDGAVWLKTTEFGDDKDRVLVTSDGYPTYFLADAGHYLETRERGFGAKINFLGPDHYGYVKRIQAAAALAGLKKSQIIVTQAVRLLKGGREMQMSKRRGQFITFEELLKAVKIDAARYFFLEKSPDTHMDFDLDLAKERSVRNPVYYIQYAHARMASIFRKIPNPKSQIPNKSKIKNFQILNSPEEITLMKKLIRLPEIIEDTARDYRVHRLTRYAYELARAFHNFYEKQRVITDDKELTKARLALVKAAQVVLQNTLKILAISAPEKM